MNTKLLFKKYFPGLVYGYLNRKNPDRLYKFGLFKDYNIDLLLDVGANIGLYGHAIRYSGFKQDIISFEPIKNAFEQLDQLAKNDDRWLCLNYALGDSDGESEINISTDIVSSSLLNAVEEFNKLVPGSKFESKEIIKIHKLDTVYDDLCRDKNVFMKLDTQGFEHTILQNGANALEKIRGLQLELSVQRLYEQELLYDELIAYLKSLGFNLKAIESGWYNQKNEIMQFDGIFFKD